MISAKPLGNSSILSSEGCRGCLKWKSGEVKKVWFRLFIQIPEGTGWFTFREYMYWFFCLMCDTEFNNKARKLKAEAKQASLGCIIRGANLQEMQRLTICKKLCKTSAGKAPAPATAVRGGVIPLQFPPIPMEQGPKKHCPDVAG